MNSENELRQRQALLLLLYLVMHNTPALYKYFLSITTKDMIMVRSIMELCWITQYYSMMYYLSYIICKWSWWRNINELYKFYYIVTGYSSFLHHYSTSYCLSYISHLRSSNCCSSIWNPSSHRSLSTSYSAWIPTISKNSPELWNCNFPTWITPCDDEVFKSLSSRSTGYVVWRNGLSDSITVCCRCYVFRMW